jgi:hypothetical protein
VSGAPDQVSNDEVPIPCLNATCSPQPSARTAAASPAASDEEVAIPHFPHGPALVILRFLPLLLNLVSCYGDANVPLPCPGVSCHSSSPYPPIVRPQPALQAGGRGQCPLRYG